MTQEVLVETIAPSPVRPGYHPPRWARTVLWLLFLIIPVFGWYVVWRAYFHRTSASITLRWVSFGLFLLNAALIVTKSPVLVLTIPVHLALFGYLVYCTTID
jgi:hypothetical protein